MTRSKSDIVADTKFISYSGIYTIVSNDTWGFGKNFTLSHEHLSVDELLHLLREVKIKIPYMMIMSDDTSAVR